MRFSFSQLLSVCSVLLITIFAVSSTHAETQPTSTPSTQKIFKEHAIAMHGLPKYKVGFTHFDYVNPDAPKKGLMRQNSLGTFDTLNSFIAKGAAVDGISYLYDTLTTASEDEPFTQYGLIAKEIEWPEDRTWVTFHLRENATFSDGHPITAEDVIFTFNTLISQGHPSYKAYYGDVEKVEALDVRTVKFTFSHGENRELPLIIGQLNILPKHYWEKNDFTKASLDIPLGSGPYIVDQIDAGRSITYKRNDNYWAKDLPVNKGRYNFASLRIDYYRDMSVALEAFKAGEYDFRLEYMSKLWHTAYTGPAFDSGKIIKTELKDHNPQGMQAFIYNIRRDKFKDPKVRQAIGFAFDFEFSNKKFFHDAYVRSESYFANSELAATGLPSQAELALLTPLKDTIPSEVFTTEYKAPKTDGSGRDRNQLRQAVTLLQEAGWHIKDKKLTHDKTGEVMTFEFLLFQDGFERVIQPIIQNLQILGIEASIRRVDTNQYINRLRSYDFDLIVHSFRQSNSPGNEQRSIWGSAQADIPASNNLIGIKNPAVDTLIEYIVDANTREELITSVRALDRVLLWNHYVIPQYHINKYRIAYWDKFNRPAITPQYSIGLDTWWAK